MSRQKDQGKPAIWMIALLAAAMLFAAIKHDWSDIWIYQDGVQTPASLSAELSHGVFEYEYVANGIHYIGQGQRGRNLSQASHVGQTLLVWVSATHPQYSSPDMPIFSPWVALAMVVVLVAVEIFAVKSLVRMYRPAKISLKPTAAVSGR